MTKELLLKFKNIRSPQHSGEKLLLSTLSILKNTNTNPQKIILTAITNLRPGVKVLTQVRAGRIIPYQHINVKNLPITGQ